MKLKHDCISVLGDENVIRGTRCIITGDNNRVIGDDNRVMGKNNIVLGDRCIVFGDGSDVCGDDCVVKGEDIVVDGQRTRFWPRAVVGASVDRKRGKENGSKEIRQEGGKEKRERLSVGGVPPKKRTKTSHCEERGRPKGCSSEGSRAPLEGKGEKRRM